LEKENSKTREFAILLIISAIFPRFIRPRTFRSDLTITRGILRPKKHLSTAKKRINDTKETFAGKRRRTGEKFQKFPPRRCILTSYGESLPAAPRCISRETKSRFRLPKIGVPREIRKAIVNARERRALRNDDSARATIRPGKRDRERLLRVKYTMRDARNVLRVDAREHIAASRPAGGERSRCV